MISSRIMSVFNTVHQHPVLTFVLVLLCTEIPPESLHLLMALYTVDGGIFKVFAILHFSEIFPQFLEATCCISVNFCTSLNLKCSICHVTDLLPFNIIVSNIVRCSSCCFELCQLLSQPFEIRLYCFEMRL